MWVEEEDWKRDALLSEAACMRLLARRVGSGWSGGCDECRICLHGGGARCVNDGLLEVWIR